MRSLRLLPVLLALGLAALGGQPGGAATPEQLVFVRDGDLWSAAPDGTNAERLTRSTAAETGPALSPDGRTLAFASNRSGENEVYSAETRKWESKLLTRNPGRDDSSAAWSPDGNRLAWASSGDVYTMNAQGNARLALATTAAVEENPAWSPDGKDIVYAADGDLFVMRPGGAPRRLTSGAAADGEPDWSRRGAIAFARDGAIHVVDAAGGDPRPVTAGPNDSGPSWSPDGNRIVFARAGAGGSELLVVGADGDGTGRVLLGGADADWGVVGSAAPEKPPPQQRPGELLPDLDQRAPTGLAVAASGGRFKVGFVSAVDNIGRGPVWLVGSRPTTRAPMRVTQLVALRGGGRRAYPGAGVLRYTVAPEHSHWHYQRFENYELRRTGDFALVARDHKSGFCLADHYGYAAARLGIRRPRPRFLGNCERGNLQARWVEQGSSVGFTDRYPAHYHGQNVDVTGLPAGTYWLVHRANPFGGIRELRRDNNAAAVLIRLSWPTGRSRTPTISVLRICEGAERCPAPTVP